VGDERRGRQVVTYSQGNEKNTFRERKYERKERQLVEGMNVGQQGGMAAGRKRGDVCVWMSRYGGEIDAGWMINAVAGSNVGEKREIS